MVAQGEYCAQISFDAGSKWQVIPESANRSMDHGFFDPADRDKVILAEGWRIKEAGRFTQREAVHLHINGSRELLVSADGGKSFAPAQYERIHGYKQVYGLEPLPAAALQGMPGSSSPSSSPADPAASASGVLVGAHSGVYVGAWASGSSSAGSSAGSDPLHFRRLPDPPGVVSGLPDIEKRVGGLRGATVTPDGSWVYVAYVLEQPSWVNGGRPFEYSTRSRYPGNLEVHELQGCTNTSVVGVFAAPLEALMQESIDPFVEGASLKQPASDIWKRVDSGLDGVACQPWAWPRMDPRSDGTHHRLLIGTLGGGRNGLWMGEFVVSEGRIEPGSPSLSQEKNSKESHAYPVGHWSCIANSVEQGFNMTQGWEYRTWRPFSFAFAPLSWPQLDSDGSSGPTEGATPNYSLVYASGDMNLMRSNMQDNEWPHGENSWINIYTHKPPGEPLRDL